MQRVLLSSSPELKLWHPYDTALDTVMRRLVVGIWQIREITPEELRAHVDERQATWLREAGIHRHHPTLFSSRGSLSLSGMISGSAPMISLIIIVAVVPDTGNETLPAPADEANATA